MSFILPDRRNSSRGFAPNKHTKFKVYVQEMESEVTTRRVPETVFATIALCYFVILAGCGGSNGSNGNSGGGSTLPPPVPTIVVSGSASVTAGQASQYIAKENGADISSSAAWAVNGVNGGNSTVGTVSTSGLYSAPSAVPTPAIVTITAASNGATSGSISVTIITAIISPPPPPNPMIVSFTATPGTITSGTSTTLSWTTMNAVGTSIDQGVGNVTPVSQGSISVSPTMTTIYTLTATGAAGTMPATATAMVTVNPVTAPVLQSAAPPIFHLTGGINALQAVEFSLTCDGCVGGDKVTETDFEDQTLPGTDPVTTFFVTNQFTPSTFYTGLLTFQVISPNGNSNMLPIASIGDQNPLAFAADGSAFVISQPGKASKYDPTGKLLTSFDVGTAWQIAVDNPLGQGNTSTGDVVVAIQQDFINVFDSNGNEITTITNSGTDNASAVAAANGLTCGIDADHPQLLCAYLPGASIFSPPPTATQSLSAQGLMIGMAYVDNKTYAIVLTADGKLAKYEVAGNSQAVVITLIGDQITFSGFTPLSQIPVSQLDQNGNPQKSLVDAGWSMAAFNTGSVAGNAIVHDRFDGLAFGVGLSQFQTTWTEQAPGYRIAADEANGVANVAIYNVPPTTTTSYAWLDGVSGKLTQRKAETAPPSVAVGHGVNPSTGKIWACAATCQILDNQ